MVQILRCEENGFASNRAVAGRILHEHPLPRETIRQRIAANEIAERVRGMQERTRPLGHFLGRNRPNDRTTAVLLRLIQERIAPVRER